MSTISFFKMTGSGNDFVMIDGRAHSVGLWTPQSIVSICSRRMGVGADGLVVLEPGSDPRAVRFHFFNNDGERAAMCGNASLCATRLAAQLGLADPAGMRLETDAGVFETRCLDGSGERAELDLPEVTLHGEARIQPVLGEDRARLATVGVPHLVVLVEEDVLAAPDLMERGRELRWHPALGPEGANVNFVGKMEGRWRMRTYERGVEGETLACGTGAVAAVVVLTNLGRAQAPCDILTSSGKCLTVSSAMPGGDLVGQPRLGGEGRLVFRGEIAELVIRRSGPSGL
jgi:diaminopimelate epimerase